ncbi:hypothetical protein HMPREF1354_02682, partial [Enterococcus faecium 514]
ALNFLKRKKRTIRKEHDARQNNGGFILCEIQHTNNKKSKIKKPKFVQNRKKCVPANEDCSN